MNVRPAIRLWKWQGQKDSNPRPSVLETDALPTELYPYGPTTDRLLGQFDLWKQGLKAQSAPSKRHTAGAFDAPAADRGEDRRAGPSSIAPPLSGLVPPSLG